MALTNRDVKTNREDTQVLNPSVPASSLTPWWTPVPSSRVSTISCKAAPPTPTFSCRGTRNKNKDKTLGNRTDWWCPQWHAGSRFSDSTSFSEFKMLWMMIQAVHCANWVCLQVQAVWNAHWPSLQEKTKLPQTKTVGKRVLTATDAYRKWVISTDKNINACEESG